MSMSLIEVISYLKNSKKNTWIETSEGDRVICFNSMVEKWLKQPCDEKWLAKIKQELGPSWKINLNDKGLVQAASRNIDEDTTNYNAIWVRDAAWIFFTLLKQNKVKARELLLALWDYYSSIDQQKRMNNIISNPILKDDSMEVLHVRFDGNSKNFTDVVLNGEPEKWNHKQQDAHGLFLLAFLYGLKSGVIETGDWTVARKQVIEKFPKYFIAIDFSNYQEAGAWEEIDKINTSSVAMVTKVWEMYLNNEPDFCSLLNWNNHEIQKLYDSGKERVIKQLNAGGESPLYQQNDWRFRTADAALFNLFLPHPLEFLDKKLIDNVLAIMQNLVRPAGIIRYQGDSYQSGNYWFQSHDDGPTATGDSSNLDDFKIRKTRAIPNSEAEWFFDSNYAWIYALLARDDRKYLKNAIFHFKRALGQITGEDLISADGNEVAAGLIPESLNRIYDKDVSFYLPSPITPLNWALASLWQAHDVLSEIMTL